MNRLNIVSHAVQANLKTLANVKNTIAIASGKGGVGKSTVAVNLALALSSLGTRVGLLDADIYGPSQGMMLGIAERPIVQDKKMKPIEKYGIQSMSMAYLVEESTPMVWRGPMVSMALQQMLNDTLWDDLDFLIIDLPPGTGDIQLTLVQKIPLTAAIIVTTPQDIALLDAARAIEMFAKVRVPVLGVIENMSYHLCDACGHQDFLFGEGGGERIAKRYKISLLGKVPLLREIREHVDAGQPSVVINKESEVSQIFHRIAQTVMDTLFLQSKDYTSKFPKIIIDDK